MSLRAFVLLLVIAVGMFATFRKPFHGLILYIVLVYVNPYWHWWGAPLIPLRFFLVIAVATVASYFFHRRDLAKQFQPVLIDKLMVAFLLSMLISVAYGLVILEQNFDKYIVRYVKYVVLYFLMIRLIRTKQEYDTFLWANIIGCFYLGVTAYMGEGTYEQGRLERFGGAGWQESGGLAIYICVVLPFLLDRYFLGSKRVKLSKITIIVATAFILRTLVQTQTRAAFLAVLVMAIVLLWNVPKLQQRYKYFVMFAIGVAGILYLADEHFWDRMGTIESDYESIQEESGEDKLPNRFDLWMLGLEFMRQHPLTGLGPGNYLVFAHERFPSLDGKPVAAHNMFVLIGSENGVPGLTILLAIVISSLVLLHRIRRQKLAHPAARSIYQSSVFLEMSFVGFLVNGIFYNAIYLEVFFWLCAAIVALYQISLRTQEEIGHLYLLDTLQPDQALVS